MTWLGQRIAGGSLSDAHWALLNPDDVVKRRDAVRAQLKSPDTVRTARIDAASLAATEIRKWLRGLGVRGVVDVLWITDQTGIRLDFDRFVDAYDDVWYPGSDDVWIVDSTESWVLELDHEERFSLFRQVLATSLLRPDVNEQP